MKKMTTNGIKTMGALFCALTCFFSYCEPESELAAIKAEITRLENELTNLEKSNPRVYYADKDKCANVRKNLKDTVISRQFVCPFHHGCNYVKTKDGVNACTGCLDPRTKKPMPCKAAKNYSEWCRLRDQIGKTQKIDARSKTIKDKLVVLRKKRTLVAAQAATAKPPPQPKPTEQAKPPTQVKPPAEETPAPMVIKIKRSTVDKLLKDKEVKGSKVTLILVED